MQIYQNHVVFQSFSDLYYVDMAEQKRQERRRQALEAIQAAAAMSSVREQYNALRKTRSRREADEFYHRLITKGVEVNMPPSSHDEEGNAARIRWADASMKAIEEEEEEQYHQASASSSQASTPSASRPPSLLRESRTTARRRQSNSSVDTDATSTYSVEPTADANKSTCHPHFYVPAGDDEEDLSYPAALYSSSVARRRQRIEADVATLEDTAGVTGRLSSDIHDLSLKRY